MTVAELRKLKRRYSWEMGALRRWNSEAKTHPSKMLDEKIDRQRRELQRLEKLLREAT